MSFDIDSFESISRWGIGFVGFVLSIAKIKRLFARGKLKDEVKIDLEILEKIKHNDRLFDQKIEDKILRNLRKAYEEKSDNIFNLFYGIGIFVAFGLGAVQNLSEGNIGWAIATLVLSFAGLGVALDINENKKESDNKLFWKIGIFDKSNFFFATIISVISMLILGIFFWTHTTPNWWYLIATMFLILGLYNFSKCIRRLD